MFAPFDQILHWIDIQRRATHGRETGIGLGEIQWAGKRLNLELHNNKSAPVKNDRF